MAQAATTDLGTMLVLVAIWVVGGLLVGILAGSIWKGVRPWGEIGDYGLSVVVAILVGLADWYLLPVFKLSRPMIFAAAVTEPFLAALLALWILRKVKKPD
jgi:uncharacterized membrane protein YeaQ/YmgE (transglycosylase-associated protein family)